MTVQEIKKAVFARRNGVVADRLRSAGDPHHFIMGCNLVEVMQVAQMAGKDSATAQALWDARDHRECRLAAPMLYRPEEMTLEKAMEWVATVESHEVADNLCHKLLRHCPFASELVARLLDDPSPMTEYTAYRLRLNLIVSGALPEPDAAERARYAELSRQRSGATARVLRDLQLY